MNILKKAREKSKLTLDDVRYLLSLKSWSMLSKVESGKCFPTKEIAIGYHLLFGISIHDIFQSEIDGTRILLEGYAESRIEDMHAKTNGITQVERILALEQIKENVSN